MVDVIDSVTTLMGAFFAHVEMVTTWTKMDASVMVKGYGDNNFMSVSQWYIIASWWILNVFSQAEGKYKCSLLCVKHPAINNPLKLRKSHTIP